MLRRLRTFSKETCMRKTIWKWIECILAVLLLAAAVCGVTLLRAASQVEAVWQKAQEKVEAVTLPNDPAFGAPTVTVLGWKAELLSASLTRSLDEKLPDNAVYDFVQARLPQYADRKSVV